jgi:hypothetical protein
MKQGPLEEPGSGRPRYKCGCHMKSKFNGGRVANPTPITSKNLAYSPKTCLAPSSIAWATCSGDLVPAKRLATASLMMEPIAEGMY